ncbi:MmcQ/YjbR family DNA-binding protein [Collinsella sp. zg1085]|uniref:MmcQ/YjbR family DNA-binding protein n=1 Tax=Collinsella sp. zg1085 TaxID=2844380 RepID=UPI001C0CFA9B|nr:MmcQ/YjbR family DNA-binding protein [Collinsella sp. zg1085]QWT18198.1 MmcQ/YjbR family DNA-binding protein [Collinsella sp. zg1085]
MIDDELLQVALETARALPGVEIYSFAPGFDAARVAGKWFLNTTVRTHRLVNVKAYPADVQLLIEQFVGITPAYHMNKQHWICLNPAPDVDAGLVAKLVEDAYRIVFASLPKSKQKELIEQKDFFDKNL